MQHEFWLNCWQNNQLGWQQDAAHPLLLQAPPDWLDTRPVFVPLCGKSPDLSFLAKNSVVIGSELAQIACRDFFTENDLHSDYQQVGQFGHYTAGNIQIWQGDFFALQPDQVKACERIYDRAALIALPETMRHAYVQQLRKLLPVADLLLLSLEYPQHEKVGPPFNVPAAEVYTLFDFAEISLLQTRDLTGAGFAKRKFATSLLTESCWWIRWQ